MDRYNLTARVYPMILFYSPISALLMLGVWDFQQYWHYGVPAGVVGLLTYLMAQFGRDAGKSKEPTLWDSWGGAPTTQLFRWSNPTIGRRTKERNHAKMELICPIGHVVDSAYEAANADDADDAYKTWTRFIIGKTRDTVKFPLIFKENIAYGFRRNLWGLKPYAVILILIMMGSIFGYFSYTVELKYFASEFFVAEGILLALLLFWTIVVTKRWVSVPAWAYAERLHEAIEDL